MAAGKVRYYAAAISSAVIWGFFSIPLRSLNKYPPHQILYYRIFVSLLLTWAIVLVFRKKELRSNINYITSLNRESRRELIWLTLLAGVLITGNWFTFIYAVNTVSLKSAAFAYMVCPLITAMGGFLILKEHLSSIKLIAIGIAFVSILILAQGSLTEVMWSVFIASLYAFYLIIQRAVKVIDKLNMLAVQLFISSLLILPLFIYQFTSLPADAHFWATIFLIALVFTIIPLFLSLYALIGMPSSTLGILIYINPVISFSVAILYFHEQVNQLQLIAYSLLLVAVIVFNWALIKGLILGKKEIADPFIDVPIE